MMAHIPDVLTAEQVARGRDVMHRAVGVDARATAGHPSEKMKCKL